MMMFDGLEKGQVGLAIIASIISRVCYGTMDISMKTTSRLNNGSVHGTTMQRLPCMHRRERHIHVNWPDDSTLHVPEQLDWRLGTEISLARVARFKSFRVMETSSQEGKISTQYTLHMYLINILFAP